MNHFIIWVLSVGLGAVAWGMLVMSDWLLRDEEERLPIRHVRGVERNKNKLSKKRQSLLIRSHREMG